MTKGERLQKIKEMPLIKFIKIHWGKLIVIVAIVIILFMVGLGGYYNGLSIGKMKELCTDTDALENLYYYTQIMASIAVILSAIIAVWQYSLTAKAERNKFKNEKIQKGIEFAEYYKDEILDKFAFLREVFKKSGIMQYLDVIDIEDMINFDADELEINMSKNNQKAIKDIIESDKFIKVVIDVAKKRGIKSRKEIDEIIHSGKEPNELELDEKETIRLYFLNSIVNSVLNNLEYFAMNYTHNIASERVVFTSLSPSYIKIVQTLYYNIAKNNHDEIRLFTNAIKLFDLWKKRKIEKVMVLREMKRKSIEYGEDAESI